jgi:hypothetical protein
VSSEEVTTVMNILSGLNTGILNVEAVGRHNLTPHFQELNKH